MNPNFHLFSHLERDILLFGPSWSHSMFLFEGLNHIVNTFVKTNQNFEKNVLDDYNNKYPIYHQMKQISSKNPNLKLLLQKLKNLRKKKIPKTCWLVGGVLVSLKNSKYSNTVATKSGEYGIISICDKEVYFISNSDGKSRKITPEEIEKPVIQSFSLTKTDDLISKNIIYKDIIPTSDFMWHWQINCS